MNRKLTFLLTLTLLILLPSLVYAFDDISSHWAEDVIVKLEGYKIISGYDDNTFRPNEFMTRAELATVINRTFGLQTETDKYIPDVTSKDWYYTEMRKVVSFGIICGDENGNTSPNDFVTREQAITMLSRAFCVATNNSMKSSYTDAKKISDWALNAILSFDKAGYITGYDDGTIRPQSNVTRAEVLVIIDRIIKENVVNGNQNEYITGNILVAKKDIVLKNVEIFGNIYVGESAANSLILSNVIIDGDMILYGPIDFENSTLKVKGQILKLYESKINSDLYYKNDEYGLSLSLPSNATVVEKENVSSNTYDSNDVIIINIRQDDKYYFMNVSDASLKIIDELNYDSIYEKVDSGKIENCEYELYKDNANSSLFILKRDNVIYELLFINIISDNLLDNVISNIELVDGKNLSHHDEIIYKNSKLCLKFRYRDGYVGVDDSYNTGVVYTGNAFFKLFIQVNMITDIEDYSTKEMMSLLEMLAKNDGKVIKKEITEVMNYDAISFEIESEDDKIISLYVIIGKNLYNFIFKGEKLKFDSVGKDIFSQLISTIEF